MAATLPMDDRRRDLLGLGGWTLLVVVTAMGGILSPPGDWYAALQKPPLTPPNAVFPVAWTLLYATMIAAAWMVWRRVGLLAGMAALLPFIAQLGANGLWSIVFFQWHRPDLALVNLVVLWLLVALTIRSIPARSSAGGLAAAALPGMADFRRLSEHRHYRAQRAGTAGLNPD